MIDILYIVIFIMGIGYLIQYRLNIKKAAEMSQDALFPKRQTDFQHILIPTEWKEMEPLSKNAKTYQYVKWGTFFALVLLFILLIMVLATDWLKSSFISSAYLFFILISAVKHKSCFYVLADGIILDGRYYSTQQIQSYKTEKIIRWHELYGYSTRVDNGYKLSVKVKGTLIFTTKYVVIENQEQVNKIQSLFDEQGIAKVA
ncbi:hypothetical protein [Metabacillus halosaccharovorans]|uniref:DUF5673 domain-containing protein n=1 Tax=Metabacillus halosaccharovorans TaxID=930124 RepID=A0ABT3DJC2_9BACI|nr:hypothetical protein [Metabacillus halosaccharovorans]MCV9887149.1 hypothetical protein [Metabacillus halosaccharovorans]